MAASGNGNGGGVVLLGCLALVFFSTPPLKGGGSARGAGFHVMRFWGVRSKAPPEVVDDAIDRAADRHGVPRGLFRAVVHVESRKNPDAVSPVGATGLAQVMPANARGCGLRGAHQLKDVLFNAGCGAQILAENLRSFGDEKLALMAYNWGSGSVHKWVKAGRPPGMVPEETRKYVPQVLALARRE